MIDARTHSCLRQPTDNMMNKSNCSRPKSTHTHILIQYMYIQRQCRIRITNTITLYESVLSCRRCSFDNAIFSLIMMLVSLIFLFFFPLIGCQYFRIKSMMVNDDDPFFLSSLFFFLIVIYNPVFLILSSCRIRS